VLEAAASRWETRRGDRGGNRTVRSDRDGGMRCNRRILTRWRGWTWALLRCARRKHGVLDSALDREGSGGLALDRHRRLATRLWFERLHD
jgi:hypothetical protein